MSDPEEGYDDDIVFELYTEQTVKELKARVAGLEAAITWALGAGEPFPLREAGQGAYWWRSELQKRAGLKWDGEKFIPE